ncbi:MAG: ABC transporter ATP-binding protein [Betaproteobacteria bacterium]|nr:ABC transporter ATP-binding protein [Betaproteobacteria bacterium]
MQLGGPPLYRELSFSVEKNEFLCIVGPSGCGKSTLLRLIGGLLERDSGEISVHGQAPATAWQSLSYVFQSPRLAPWRNAVENVMLAAELRFERPDRDALRTKALALLDLVGLSRDAQKFPSMLSGGERQRVAIARALIVEPEIILMDEPFSALDINTRGRLRNEIISIWGKTAKTIVFVTHDVEEAVLLADRIIVLTGKPSRVCEIIPVDQPRPRDVRANAELAAIRQRLEDMMRTLETHES